MKNTKYIIKLNSAETDIVIRSLVDLRNSMLGFQSFTGFVKMRYDKTHAILLLVYCLIFYTLYKVKSNWVVFKILPNEIEKYNRMEFMNIAEHT